MGTEKRYIILIGDGMGDYPLEELNGKTPLEVAKTPNMDRIASVRCGLVHTIPEGMHPGSDIAIMSILGYDPKVYHNGRAPLEALSQGIILNDNDTVFRMNLVSLSHRSSSEIVMMSHSAGDISNEEAYPLIEALREDIHNDSISIFKGVAYRHILIWNNIREIPKTIPPHDLLGKDVSSYLKNIRETEVGELIWNSWKILNNHPVNISRRNKGLLEANSIWLWGEGRRPNMPTLRDRYGIGGVVISAVDLVKGLGIAAGLTPIHVRGATGYIDTNYRGKVSALFENIERNDLLILHLEAPDEAGHAGDPALKIDAIERFDRFIVGPVLEGLIEKIEDFIGNMDFDEFMMDEKTKSAVVREIEVIGEAAKNIPKSIMERYKNIPWSQMAKTRDKIIHFYFGVDYEIVWKVVKERLSEIKPLIKKILDELKDEEE